MINFKAAAGIVIGSVVGIFLFGTVATGLGAPVAYWSFNADSTAPDIGSNSLAITWEGIGLSSQGWGSGTTLAAQPGYPAGSSLEFIDPFAIFPFHRLIIGGLDFSGKTGASLSLAYRSDQIFEVGETTEVFYRQNAGAWVFSAVIPTPTDNWQSIDIAVPGADGNDNVDFAILNSAVFEIGSILEFDNITISAIPEPGAGAALLVALACALVIRKNRKHRRTGAPT